jgi:hypothetical protein
MALLENSDPRVQTQFKRFGERLNLLVKLQVRFDRGLVEHVKKLIAENEADFKKATGYDFPPLSVFVLPSLRFIICPRKDLEPLEIQNQVLVWLRQFHSRGFRLEAQEVALAIRHCWPHCEPPIEHFRTDPKLEGSLH